MTSEAEYNILIQNWHDLAGSNYDYFAKFTFEFLSFIAYLSTKSYPYERRDRGVINKLKEDQNLRSEYLQNISENVDLTRCWQNVIEELNNKPLTNTSVRPGRSVNSRQNRSLQINDLEDWENMVEFWYTVRNNLFHGGKNPQFQRDKLLVENSYKTLSPFVDILIDKY